MTVRVASTTAVFLTMSLLGLGLSMRSLNRWDESWFLAIVGRLREGDVLYRDVSYGAGPLPVYLTEAMTYLVGHDIFAEKLVVALTFAATATLVWLIAERLELALRGRLLVLGAVAYFAAPLPQPPYSPLATMFVVAAVLAALVFRTAEAPRERTLAALAGGAACGLAFVCKQNVGIYALVALAFVLLVDRRLKDTVYAVATFGASVCLVLLPVVVTGGFWRYVDYGFTGKGEYLNAGMSFTASLVPTLHTIRDIDSPATAESAYWAWRFFLPILAVAAVVVLVATTRRRRSFVVLPLVAFAVVAGATLFPRSDLEHVVWAAPILVLPLAYVLHLWRASFPRAAWIVVAVWLGAAVAIMATLPLRLARSPEANLSDLPHLRGAFVAPGDVARWRREAAQLSAAADRRADAMLLLVSDAGFRYLTSGLNNPTAFDFPWVTTFGRDGQERVIRALEAGRIERVCLANEPFGYAPSRLVRYVRSTMRRGTALDICTVYSLKG